jgi:peptide/nickel transport system substrate-binding protein
MVHGENPSLSALSRRRFLALAGAAGAGAWNWSALAAQGTAPTEFKEAPILAEQVAAGTLPAVKDRLPANPLVVEPVEQIGKFGGTWRTALVGGDDTAWLIRTIGYENLVRWDVGWQEVIPNVAESWEASPDAKEYTFKLRAGLKWSDGEPLTADDIMFYVNDVQLNPELTASQGSNPFTAEKIDDLTVKVTLDHPDGLFMQNLATPNAESGEAWTRYPKHYLQQFHATYNTTNLDQLIGEAGVATWVDLFNLKGGGVNTPADAVWSNADLPQLHPWQIVEEYGAGSRVTAKRNPFYFKVDPEGNQLPYIDEVVYDVLEDPEVLLLKVSNGEIDMHARHINNNINKPVLSDNQEKGQYHFFDTVPSSMNTAIVALNLTHKDPALREVFQNRDLRIGLSYAINRQEIIDAVFVGQGEPWQAAPRVETAFYNETLAKQYTEYDVAKANEYLDKALPNKDGDGLRQRADGQRLSFVMEVATGLQPEWIDAMNLVVGYWREVGIDVQLKPEDRSLLYTRKDANDHDCVIWGGDGGLRDAMLDPRWYFPSGSESNFAQAWAVWFNPDANPETEAEEPPAAVKQQMDLYKQLQVTADPAQQIELFKQILQIAQEQFYVIGISLPAPGYGIAKNNFKNVPTTMPNAWLYPTPAPTNPAQYSFV